MLDYNLNIKRIFLSFLQQLFKQDPKYTWDVSLPTTKILIVDKYAVDLSIIEKRDSIVLSRGSLGWRNLTIGQLESQSIPISGVKKYSDLIRGSVTINCISTNGITAEYLSSKIATSIISYKDQFRKNGLHELINIQIGEESILKASSITELNAVPINVSFEVPFSTFNYTSYNDLSINGLTELLDYRVTGTQEITLFDHVDRTTNYDLVYINAITLEEMEENLTPSDNNIINTNYHIKGIPIIEVINIETELDEQ